MRVDHIALWVDDIERMKKFYLTYFDLSSNERYVNPVKGYTSYFLSFNEGGTRIELMNRPDIDSLQSRRGMTQGLAHLTITIGSKDKVDWLTERLRADGYIIAGEPRTSGDGYYESVVLDPEGNMIELLA